MELVDFESALDKIDFELFGAFLEEVVLELALDLALELAWVFLEDLLDDLAFELACAFWEDMPTYTELLPKGAWLLSCFFLCDFLG